MKKHSTALFGMAVVLLGLGIFKSGHSAVIVKEFDYDSGIEPTGALYQGLDGKLFGMTLSFGRKADGSTGVGTIFRITPNGTTSDAFETIRVMGSPYPESGHPQGSLAAGISGSANMYGLFTDSTGSRSTFFEVTPQGQITNRYTSPDSPEPAAFEFPHTLLRGGNGDYYIAALHPDSVSSAPRGRIVRMTPVGSPSIMHDTPGLIRELIAARAGDFYGIYDTTRQEFNNDRVVHFFHLPEDGPASVVRTLGYDPCIPHRMIVAPDNSFIGVGYNPRQICRITTDGTTSVVAQIPPSMGGAYAVGVTADGSIYSVTSVQYLDNQHRTFLVRIEPSGMVSEIESYEGGLGIRFEDRPTLQPIIESNLLYLYLVGPDPGFGRIVKFGPLPSSSNPPPAPSAPTLSLTASPSTIAVNESTTLAWTSSNVTTCSFSGEPSGSRAASGSRVVSHSAPGSYSYSMTCDGTDGSVTRSATVSVTSGNSGGDGAAGATPLTNAVPVPNLSGAQGSEHFFSVVVPANATSLAFHLGDGTGDADLYVRFGAPPEGNLEDGTAVYDCVNSRIGNVEYCGFSNPQAGTYYVLVRGFREFTGARLVARYTVGGESVCSSDSALYSPMYDYSYESHSANFNMPGPPSCAYASLEIPPGVGSIRIEYVGSTGRAYVRSGSPPSPQNGNHDCEISSVSTICTMNNPNPGQWYFAVTDADGQGDIYVTFVEGSSPSGEASGGGALGKASGGGALGNSVLFLMLSALYFRRRT